MHCCKRTKEGSSSRRLQNGANKSTPPFTPLQRTQPSITILQRATLFQIPHQHHSSSTDPLLHSSQLQFKTKRIHSSDSPNSPHPQLHSLSPIFSHSPHATHQSFSPKYANTHRLPHKRSCQGPNRDNVAEWLRR